ncbi:MAG: hypothetical protein ACOY3Z_11920 [Thermodesulfobacteriota bacterium]
MRIIPLLLTLSLLAGCASAPGPVGWKHQPVEARKNAPLVLIHPLENAGEGASLGVLPFQVPDNLRREQGEAMGLLFKDVLLGKQAFPRIIGIKDGYLSQEEAATIGRKAGVDLVLAGRVTHALEGSQFGGGRLEVASRIIDTHSGNTVWYVEQSMDQPMAYPKSSTLDRFVAAFNPPEIKPSQAGPVLPNMLAQVAHDLAEVIGGAGRVSR